MHNKRCSIKDKDVAFSILKNKIHVLTISKKKSLILGIMQKFFAGSLNKMNKNWKFKNVTSIHSNHLCVVSYHVIDVTVAFVMSIYCTSTILFLHYEQ